MAAEDDPRERDTGGVPPGPPARIRLFNANNAAFLGVTLAFGAVAVALGLGWFGEWREPDCTAYPVQSVASPSGRLRAVQEQEACGSTDRLRTSVILHLDGAPEGIEVLRVETGSALGAMSVGQRSLPLRLEWAGDARLSIHHPAGLSPTLADSADGVRIEAHSLPRP